MTDSNNKVAFRVLNWIIGLILAFIVTEALVSYIAGESPVVIRMLRFILIPVLVGLGLAVRRARKSEQSAHALELDEMQRAEKRTSVRYKSLLEWAGDAIFVINAENGRLEEMNGMGTVLLGYSREEMGALSSRELFPAKDHLQFTSLVRRVNRHGIASSDGLTFRRKDGSRFLGEVNARLIDLGDEKLVQAIVRNITHKKQAEQDIRKRNRKLSVLNSIIARANSTLDLHTVLDVILKETLELFGAEGGMIHLLEGEEESLTLVAQTNLSKNFITASRQLNLSLTPLCLMPTTRQCARLTDASRPGCQVALHAREEGWQSVAGIPLFAKNRLVGLMHIMNNGEHNYVQDDLNFFTTMGNQVGIVIEHARLFAELNRKTAELLRSHRLLEKNSRQLALSEKRLRNNLALVEQANLDLERFARMKSHFLGMVSHEFKTPLTGILGSVEYLLVNHGKASADDERHLLSIIQDGGKRLNEIVTDLLKVFRLEAQGTLINKAPLHLEELLTQVVDIFTPMLQERNHRVIFQGVDAIPYFCGDRECLHDVFTRLLENAVKFTPDGGETVINARVTDRRELATSMEYLARFNPSFCDQMGTTSYLQVEVRDSGVGIASDERFNIFDTFYEIGDIRHHSSGKDKFQGKGAGLGLAIVKGMIEANGGMVWVDSPEPASTGNPGSSFFLLIPLEEGPNQSLFPFMQQEQVASSPGLFDFCFEEKTNNRQS